MKQYRMLVVATMCVGLMAGYAQAEGDDMNDKLKDEREAFKEEHKAEREAFREKQKAENEEFRKTLEGLSGNARIDAVIKHREEEFAERMAFKKTMNEERIASMKEKMAAEGIAEDKQAEMLAKAEERYQEKVTEATERNAEAIAKLQAIKDDASLSDEQKDAALKELWEASKEKRQEWKDKQSKEGGDSEKSE